LRLCASAVVVAARMTNPLVHVRNMNICCSYATWKTIYNKK